jgi:hypothetical protein
MTQRFYFVLSLVSGVICLAPPLFAGNISGRISKLDPAQVPTGIRIIVSPADAGKPVINQVTGEYSIPLTNNQEYQITFRANQSIDATIIGLNGSSTARDFNIFLPNAPDCVPCRPRRILGRLRCAAIEGPSTSAIAALCSANMPVAMGGLPQRIVELATETQFIEHEDGFREWTNANKTITVLARLVEVSDDVAVFEREDGRVARTRLERLSTADQEWIRMVQSASTIAALPPVPATR